MLKISNKLYLFISYYIDQHCDLIYHDDTIIYSKPYMKLSVLDILSLRVLSIEQNVPVKMCSFPQLTSDLSIEVVGVLIVQGVLHMYFGPKVGFKKIKLHRQLKAAEKKLGRIFPYSEFAEDVVFHYET